MEHSWTATKAQIVSLANINQNLMLYLMLYYTETCVVSKSDIDYYYSQYTKASQRERGGRAKKDLAMLMYISLILNITSLPFSAHGTTNFLLQFS